MAFASLAFADQPVETLPGFTPNNVYESHGIDNVNLNSGDPGIVIPVGPSYSLGPGLDWQLKAYYTAKVWQFDTSCTVDTTVREAMIHGYPTLGVGWTLELGYIGPTKDGASGPGSYHAPDGSIPSETTASHLRLRQNPGATYCTAPCWSVDFPDGTTHVFEHAYNRPRPTVQFNVINEDFTDENYRFDNTTTLRYGLTKILNKFGATVLTVQYVANIPTANADEVNTIKIYAGQTKTITYNWATINIPDSANGNPTWRVLSSIDFPAPQAATLSAAFTLMAADFPRNSFSASSIGLGTGQCGTAANTAVPLLNKITLSDKTTGNILSTYTMTPYTAPVGFDQGWNTSILGTLALPTGGSINYIYKATGPHCADSFPSGLCADIETEVGGQGAGPLVADSGPLQFFQAYVDNSPGIVTRTAQNKTGGALKTTNYARNSFIHVINFNPEVIDNYSIGRQVLVTEDSGNSAGTFVTKYIFHVAFFGDGGDPEDGGLELERRYYAENNDGSGTPIRTLINCYAQTTGPTSESTPVCGYKGNSTTLQDYNLNADPRRQASATWYGMNPSTADGGTCSQSSVACSKSANTPYDFTSLAYKTNTLTSTIPVLTTGWTSRATTTTWTSKIDATHYLLDLYTQKQTADAAGSSAPLTTTTNYDFLSADSCGNDYGMLRSNSTADGTNTLTTTYADTSGTGSCLGNPTLITRSSSGSGMTPAETFPDTLTFQNGQPLTSLRTGLTWKQFDSDRDANTNVIITSRDPNGLSTGYTYDALGRLRKIQPPGGDAPRSFCYFLPNSYLAGLAPFALVKQIANACTVAAPGTDDGVPIAGSGLIEGYQYDDIGRLVKHIREQPNANAGSYFSFQETRYDSAGHVSFLSEWTPCGTLPTATNIGNCISSTGTQGTSYSSFDAFGRAQKSLRADGTFTISDHTDVATLPAVPCTAAIPYAGGTTNYTDYVENTTTCSSASATVTGPTVTRDDALGRVISVKEAPVGGTADTTLYAYNVLDKVACVLQGTGTLVPCTASTGQKRTFSYDSLGLLRSETNPENGTSSYGQYDGLGNLRSKTLGSGTSAMTTTTAYEVGGRLTSVATSEGRTYVQNTYDINTLSSPPNPSYPLGRLTKRIGNTFPLDQGPIVLEEFGYGGTSPPAPEGQLSKKVTTTGSGTNHFGTRDGEGVVATETWGYDSIGVVSAYNHPRSSGTYAESPTYKAGLQTSATANGTTAYSAVTYHPAATLFSWIDANSTPVTTTIQESATTLIPRPTSITTTGGSPNFSSGTYAYDGAGNITAIGGDTFKYDARSRLASADYGFASPSCTDYLSNPNRDQCFAYDRFGNLTDISGTNFRPLPTSLATNQLTGQSYDTRGNMFSGQGFDGLDRVSGAFGWLYFYNGAGEREAKFPDVGILRREMAVLLLQARNVDNVVADTCTTSDPNFPLDVACGDPDRKWIDTLFHIGITAGCATNTFCPGSVVTRDQMATFIVRARNEAPATGCDPNNLTFSDVLCTNGFWGYIQKIYTDGITAGCGVDGNLHPIYCPSNPVLESQMMAFMKRSWSTFLFVPRGTIYTFRNVGDQVETEMMSKPGSISYPTSDFPIATTPTRDNTFLGNLLVASNAGTSGLGGTPGRTYYHSDHLGTPRLITGVETTNPVLKYWPYGDEVSGNPITSQRLKFASMERDSETNHFSDHARHHDFNLGRFVSVDKNSGSPGSPQSWNRYSYARNNPVKLKDENGLDPNCPTCGAQETADMTRVEASQGNELAQGRMGTSAVQGIEATNFELDLVSLGTGFLAKEGVEVAAEVGEAAFQRATTTEVTHFTDSAGKAGIEASREIRAGSYVTKAGEVKGLSPKQIETKLEIGAGKGENSFTATVKKSDLKVPDNGPKTSGGAYQRQLATPCKVGTPGCGSLPPGSG